MAAHSTAGMHPGALEATTTSQQDEKSGEVVALMVKKNPNLTEHNLIEHCRGQLTGVRGAEARVF